MTESKIHLTSGKILKEATEVVVEYTESRLDANPAEHSGTFKDLPKPELVKALASLEPHVAFITEFIDTPDKFDSVPAKDLEVIKTIHVSGFSLSDSSKKGVAVMITAQKTLSTGKVFGFNIGPVYFDDSSENSYKHTSQLYRDIENVKELFVKYIDGDHAPDPQQSLNFEQKEPVTKIEMGKATDKDVLNNLKKARQPKIKQAPKKKK